MSYFPPTYFGASYFASTGSQGLDDALAGASLLTITPNTSNSPLAWHWRDWITPDEPTTSIDDEALALAILLAA